ncbi:MAG: hypothetical protein M1449_10815 [Candidatus Thermoplasmatota archaeon]|nr:hypothetical protein [Candidatus Thermoplasmatota archaeon]
MRIRPQIFISLAALLPFNPAWAAGEQPEIPMITEFRVRHLDASQAYMEVSGAQRAMEMSGRVGESLAHVRSEKSGGQILRLNRKLTRAQAWDIANRMVQQGNGEIMYAEPIDPSFNPNEPEPSVPPPLPTETTGRK